MITKRPANTTAGRRSGNFISERTAEIKQVKQLLLIVVGIYLLGWASFVSIMKASEVASDDLQSLSLVEPAEIGAQALEPVSSPQDNAKAGMDARIPEPAVLEPPISARPLPEPPEPELPTAAPPTLPSLKPEKVAPVPPGDPPSRVSMAHPITCTRCWDSTGLEYIGNQCGQLLGFEKVIRDRLYVVENCASKVLSTGGSGELDLGIEIDFSTKRIGFWSEPSSEVAGASDIAACLKIEMGGLPMDAIHPKLIRYQLAMSVTLKRTATAKPAAPIVVDVPPVNSEKLAQGRIVAVVRDRVRVRKKPVDGEILGKISSGNRVLLIDQREDWCQVKTPRGNVGWMVCWGLAL
ncbi:MAG: SH3 domain-containing protein [Myxococcota bacterium]|nr:SH3 domain-containing protein [Myxococcota bacterium]